MFPQKARAGVAYSISKHFVIWYAKTDAERFGKKGVRVLSVTRGILIRRWEDSKKQRLPVMFPVMRS